MPEFPTGAFDNAMDNLSLVFQSMWDFLVSTSDIWFYYLLGVLCFILIFRLFLAIIPIKKK